MLSDVAPKLWAFKNLRQILHTPTKLRHFSDVFLNRGDIPGGIVEPFVERAGRALKGRNNCFILFIQSCVCAFQPFKKFIGGFISLCKIGNPLFKKKKNCYKSNCN